MIVTLASSKGGAGKTTSAVHIAAYFQTLAPTLLLDGDETLNALAWEQRGTGFTFKVAPIGQAAKLARSYTHIVIDTGQRLRRDDLKAAIEGCDLLVVPSAPSSLDADGLGQTIRALKELGATSYRVLLARVAPDAAKEAAELRALLAAMKVPVLKAEIPRLKAFEKAAASGHLVNEVDDRNASRAWEAYTAAGKEMIQCQSRK